jgi:hypothetical protein
MGKYYWTVLFFILFAATSLAAENPGYQSDMLTVRLAPRTPQQIAAFYIARGFTEKMVNILRQQCFITISIKNTSQQIIWLDLSNWKFRNSDGEIRRLDRNYWFDEWRDMKIPLAHQSTFRWTLLPEQLDFRPGEREGGNIILPRDNQAISIQARFATGADKSGTPVIMKLDNIRCAEDR